QWLEPRRLWLSRCASLLGGQQLLPDHAWRGGAWRDVRFPRQRLSAIGKREKWQATSTSTSTISTAPEAVLTGTSLAIQRQVIDTVTTNYLIERAMAGFDAEIGARLPVFSGDDFKLDVKAF